MVTIKLIDVWCKLYVKNHKCSYIIQEKGGGFSYNSSVIIQNSPKKNIISFCNVYGNYIQVNQSNITELVLPNYVQGNLVLADLDNISELSLPQVGGNILIFELLCLHKILTNVECKNLTISNVPLYNITLQKVNSIELRLTNIEYIDATVCTGNIILSKNKLNKLKLPTYIYGDLNISENFILSISDIPKTTIFGHFDISHNLFSKVDPFTLIQKLDSLDIIHSVGGNICY